MTAPVLDAAGVGFSYGRWRPRRVLDGLDWKVPTGSTTLLLGLNGAGKSTLLKLLCGVEMPDVGTVTIGGESGRRALYRDVGWMPQDVRPVRGLTVAEQVEHAAWVAGCSRRDARVRAVEAILEVDLGDQRDVRADRLSGGQLRRVGLAQALVRRAPILLLDEPTAGLDPAQSLNFRSILARLECPGGVVVSTHQVDELAEDVDRVAVLDGGRIVFDGSADDLRLVHAGDPAGSTSLATAFAALVGGGRR